ncbi:MAG: DeoR/GlpR family DNA-binding transcription regulator [Hungatella sp.]
MFASDRRNQISNWVYEKRHVDVSELSSFFNVSEVTIRKDLILLEKNGKLIRTYGGAISMEQANSVASQNTGNSNTSISGGAIPKLLACMVDDGDLIYLGSGILCTNAARILKEKASLSVITNNITAASILIENPNISVVMPPGEVYKKLENELLLGTETESYLSAKSVDKAIISVDSVKMNGYSINDLSTCKAYQEILNHADSIIIAAESDSFNRNAIAYLGKLNIADKIVGDKSIPEEYISYFYENRIKVFNSYNIES